MDCWIREGRKGIVDIVAAFVGFAGQGMGLCSSAESGVVVDASLEVDFCGIWLSPSVMILRLNCCRM